MNVTQTTTATLATQATLTVTGPGNVTYGNTGTAATSGGSGTGAVSFDAGASTGCSVTGTTVTVTNGSGTCSLTATKASDGNYASATSTSFSVTLNLATQAALSVTGPASVTSGTAGTATASGGSGTGALSFSAGSSTGCSVAGTTVSVTNVNGTCSLIATKASDGNYASISSAVFPETLVPATQQVTLTTAPAGLLLSVDGGTAQAAPFTATLNTGTHTISAVTQAGGPGTQFAFASWSDSGAASHTITVGGSAASYTATFQTQYLLTTGASPSAGGSVSPAAAYYNAGAVVSVQAGANSGYRFANFSGGLSGNANPQNITMNGPVNVVANFTSVTPNLAATFGAITCAGTTCTVPMKLTNTGAGTATNATIAGVPVMTLISGSGAVSVASGTPSDLGTIAPGSSAIGTVTFNWPSTAVRVQFKVTVTADGGYLGTSTITAIR